MLVVVMLESCCSSLLPLRSDLLPLSHLRQQLQRTVTQCTNLGITSLVISVLEKKINKHYDVFVSLLYILHIVPAIMA